MDPQNQNTIVSPKKFSLRSKTSFIGSFKKKLFSKNMIIFFSILFVFLIIELMFDVIEITLGEIIDWTNPLRPTTGAVWTLEYKDKTAAEQLHTILEDIPERKQEMLNINNFEELNRVLEEQPEVTISKKDFLEIYTHLPPELAQEIMSPFEMIPLARGDIWVKTKIIKGDNELRIYLLDRADQLIRDCYPSFSKYYDAEFMSPEQTMTLEYIDDFKGRIVNADEFFEAFNSLSLAKKVYIMNDPFQLLRWGDALKNVAISRYVVNGGVTIGFEIQKSLANEIHRYQASELAATHLINRINELFPTKNLQMPERKEIEISTQ